ncbi:hypothetical protein NIES30_08190 [Phormidium tenue NIES-30]|uniref:Mercuric transport protein MerT n=1 Tax=Phormidium tenue NIES-30 TaxID=549789 RepID=A0A1U7J7P3_9CYAN|nr:hypothetical protein NIES30_08190 [Phormidium tenue NIES-30]
MKKILSFLTLFTSASTLICCALPALLVSLGFGASLASFLGQYPEFIWFSEQKSWVFAFGGVVLVTAIILARVSARTTDCPTDPALRDACKNTRTVSGIVLGVSTIIYIAGGFFAYVAPKLLG